MVFILHHECGNISDEETVLVLEKMIEQNLNSVSFKMEREDAECGKFSFFPTFRLEYSDVSSKDFLEVSEMLKKYLHFSFRGVKSPFFYKFIENPEEIALCEKINYLKKI
jgi:hypothetical protein